MDLLENVRHFFVLLFWYVGERNWTVQSTSTIIKPRKEADAYRPGDLVLAKFKGKPYRAVIVRVEDEKEKLNSDKLKFDSYLQDLSLSPKELLRKMGVDANLDSSNNEIVGPTQQDNPKKQKKSKGSTSDKPNGPKVKKAKTNPAVSTPKGEEKQKREAALESSKLMAVRLLENKVDNCSSSQPHDAVSNKPNSFSASTSSTQATKSQSTDLQSSFSFASSQSPEPLQHNFFTDYSTGNNYDWNYFGSNYPNSASEYFAHSLIRPDTANTTSLDCSKCLPLINALEQRVKYLEDKLEALSSPQANTSQAHMAISPTQNMHATSPINAKRPCSRASTSSLETPSTSTMNVDKETSEIVVPQFSISQETNYTSSSTVDLVGGYEGVRITVEQLDVCLRKAKASATALARLLCGVFFTEEEMARCSARGTKDKPALDATKINAIIKYVGEKRNGSEKDIIQAINQKCADSRVVYKPKKK